MACVADILRMKGSRVHTVSPTATVLKATQTMNRHKIGALVVTAGSQSLHGADDCDRVVGMFTERDVLTRVVGLQLDPAHTLVEEVMTSDVAFCREDTPLDEIVAVMHQRRIRHLPVCESEQLRGLVSIGDLNAWNAQGLEATIQHLHEYIHGRV